MAVVLPEDPLGQRWRDARDEWRELRTEAADIATGVRSVAGGEARLAVAEVRDGIRATTRAVAFGSVAIVLALATAVWLPLPLLLGLSEAMPLWAASLATVGLMALLTLTFLLVARRRFMRISLIPREALMRVKEDKEWLRQQLFESSN